MTKKIGNLAERIRNLAKKIGNLAKKFGQKLLAKNPKKLPPTRAFPIRLFKSEPFKGKPFKGKPFKDKPFKSKIFPISLSALLMLGACGGEIADLRKIPEPIQAEQHPHYDSEEANRIETLRKSLTPNLHEETLE